MLSKSDDRIKMEVWVNTLCFLQQLQQKVQLDYKTNITQIRQKIKLYGSLTTKNLKKPHLSRRVGWVEMRIGTERGMERQRGVETRNRQSYIHVWQIKIAGIYS